MVGKITSTPMQTMTTLNREISTMPTHLYVRPEPYKNIKRLRDVVRKNPKRAKELGDLCFDEDDGVRAEAAFSLASTYLENPDPVNDQLIKDILERSPDRDPHLDLTLSVSHFLKGELDEAAYHLHQVNQNAGKLRENLDIPPALIDQVEIAPKSRVKTALLNRIVDHNALTYHGKTLLNHTYGMLSLSGEIIEYEPQDKEITSRPHEWDGTFKMQDIKQDHNSYNCFILGALASFTYSDIGLDFLRKHFRHSLKMPNRLEVGFKEVTVYLSQKIFLKNGFSPYSPYSKDWVNLFLRAYDLFLLRTQKDQRHGVGGRGGSPKELYEVLNIPVESFDPVSLKVTQVDFDRMIELLKMGMPGTLSKGNEMHLYGLIGYDEERQAFKAYDPHGRVEIIPFETFMERFTPQTIHQRWIVHFARLDLWKEAYEK